MTWICCATARWEFCSAGSGPREPSGVALLAGQVPEGVTAVAQAYAGHQFGIYVPRLGDGRALLLGEVIDAQGRRRDLHLKGSGRTRFARSAGGKAVVGPMLREYLIGEAMHGLGIAATRALAVVATGERVLRERALPGAVLTRVAASHLRVGTFQYAAASGDRDLLQALAGYAIARHCPEAAGGQNRYLDLYRRALRQAHPDGIDVLIDLVSDADGFAALAALVRPGGTAVTTKYVADPGALAAAGVTGTNFNFAQYVSGELLEQVADALVGGRIAAPPITRIPWSKRPLP